VTADRTKRPRGLQTAARLRQAAREAFADLGWQLTRVEDIVRRANVSHGTFYHYYENKTAVLEALVRESQEEFTAIAAAPWQGDDVRAELERVIGGLLDLYERDAPVLHAWLHAAREERSLAELYGQVRRLYIDRVGENVRGVIEAAGRTDVPNPETVASALVSMVEHFAYTWHVLGEPHTREDAVDAVVLVWGAALNALAGWEIVKLS
jgi:AcrR family transcriptional regulator